MFSGFHCSTDWILGRLFLWSGEWWINSYPLVVFHHIFLWVIWGSGVFCPLHNVKLGEVDDSLSGSWTSPSQYWVSSSGSSDWWTQNKLSLLQRVVGRISRNSNPEPLWYKPVNVSAFWSGASDEKPIQQLPTTEVNDMTYKKYCYCSCNLMTRNLLLFLNFDKVPVVA